MRLAVWLPATVMQPTSRAVRHFVILTILWLVFGACMGFSNSVRVPDWLPFSASQLQWTAVMDYIAALVFASLYHARSPAPCLRRLWLGIVITAAIFTLSACILQDRVYDNVVDRKESVMPLIVFGCSVAALGIASFPSSYILWRQYESSEQAERT